MAGLSYNDVLTLEAAAQMLGCSKRFLQSEIAAGHLKAAKLHHRRLVMTRRDVLRYVRDKRFEPAEAQQ